VISFGSPFVLADFPGTGLCAFSHISAAQRATAQALLGRIPVMGRMPVDGVVKKNRTCGAFRRAG
jgi:hypothetical protein